MAKAKYHITPESRRLCVTLDKRQLKEFKKMSIEFEKSLENILELAVDLLIQKYQNLSPEQIDQKGVDSFFE